MNSKNYFAWSFLVLGIASWGGVYYFWYTMQASLASYADSMRARAEQSNSSGITARLHTILRDTVDDRMTLDTIMNLDPVKITTLVDAKASSAHVLIKMSNATANTNPSENKSVSVQSFGFVASASGTFSEVMKALIVLERLPAAISIDTIDIALDQNSTTKGPLAHAWHMSAHVQVLTTTTSL